MPQWMCTIDTKDFLVALEKVRAGSSVDASSPLSGFYFHVFRSREPKVHIIGSSGPYTGAIHHVPIRLESENHEIRCVLPQSFPFQVASRFLRVPRIRLGRNERGTEVIVADPNGNDELIFEVESGWGSSGLACFPDDSFKVVDPGAYWVKGGVPTVATKEALSNVMRGAASSSVAQTTSWIDPKDIFVEDDWDEEETEEWMPPEDTEEGYAETVDGEFTGQQQQQQQLQQKKSFAVPATTPSRNPSDPLFAGFAPTRDTKRDSPFAPSKRPSRLGQKLSSFTDSKAAAASAQQPLNLMTPEKARGVEETRQ